MDDWHKGSLCLSVCLSVSLSHSVTEGGIAHSEGVTLFVNCASNLEGPTPRIMFSDRFYHHLNRKFSLRREIPWSRQKTFLLFERQTQGIKLPWHPHHTLYPSRFEAQFTKSVTPSLWAIPPSVTEWERETDRQTDRQREPLCQSSTVGPYESSAKVSCLPDTQNVLGSLCEFSSD